MIYKTLKIEIFGKVSGVGTIEKLREFAESLHLTADVKVLDDEGVVVFISGEDGALRQFINFCKQGSSFGGVDDVVVTEIV